MSSVLIIGATRGLGASLVKKYAAAGWTVFGTTRSAVGPKDVNDGGSFPTGVQWIPSVDLTSKNVGTTISGFFDKSKPLDAVVGYRSI